MKRFLIFIFFTGAFIAAYAQELLEQSRKKFVNSYPIRKEQHLEIKAYIDKLLKEEVEKSMQFFQSDFFSISTDENSLYSYRQQLGAYFCYPPPKATEGKISRFEKAGKDTVFGLKGSNYTFKRIGRFQNIGLICPHHCLVQLVENAGLFDMEGVSTEAERAFQFLENWVSKIDLHS